MELRIALLAILFIVFITISSSDAGYHKKKIIIHVPVEKSHHTHTKVQNVHHHHKPIVIKKEKVIKEIPIKIKQEITHDHFHHHYKHTHPEVIHKPHKSYKYTESIESGSSSGNSFGGGDVGGGSSNRNSFGGGSSSSFSFGNNGDASFGSVGSNDGENSGSFESGGNLRRGWRKVGSSASAATLSGES